MRVFTVIFMALSVTACDKKLAPEVPARDLSDAADMNPRHDMPATDLVDLSDLPVDMPDMFNIQDVIDRWQSVPKKCAEQAPPRKTNWGPDSYSVNTIEAQYAWSQSQAALCPQIQEYEPDQFVGDGVEVLSTFGNKLTTYTPWEIPYSNFAFGLRAVVHVDARTGEASTCDLINGATRALFAQRIVLNPWNQAPIFVAHLPDHASYTSEGTPLADKRTQWWSPAWPKAHHLTAHSDEYKEQAHRPYVMMGADGQLYITGLDGGVLSVDVASGQLNWAVSKHEIARLLNTQASDMSFNWPQKSISKATRSIHVDVSVLSRQSRHTVKIDHCGQVSLADEYQHPDQDVFVFGEGELHVGYTSSVQYPYNVTLMTTDGTQQLHLPECSDVVTLSQSSLMCLKPPSSRAPRVLPVTIVKWPNIKQDVVIDLREFYDEGASVSIKQTATALRENIVVLRVFYSKAGERLRRTDLVFYDHSKQNVIRTVTIDSVNPFVGSNPYSPVLVSDTGDIVFQAFGLLHGVKTNSSGLSATPLPRGIRFGRNGNLGAFYTKR